MNDELRLMIPSMKFKRSCIKSGVHHENFNNRNKYFQSFL